MRSLRQSWPLFKDVTDILFCKRRFREVDGMLDVHTIEQYVKAFCGPGPEPHTGGLKYFICSHVLPLHIGGRCCEEDADQLVIHNVEQCKVTLIAERPGKKFGLIGGGVNRGESLGSALARECEKDLSITLSSDHWANYDGTSLTPGLMVPFISIDKVGNNVFVCCFRIVPVYPTRCAASGKMIEMTIAEVFADYVANCRLTRPVVARVLVHLLCYASLTTIRARVTPGAPYVLCDGKAVRDAGNNCNFEGYDDETTEILPPLVDSSINS